MLSVNEYAFFSLAVYPNSDDMQDSRPSGWNRVGNNDRLYDLNEIGFAADVYVNSTTQQIVISYRGSADPSDIFTDGDATADWIQNDFPLAAGIVGPQFFAAYHVYKQIAENPLYAGYDISLTGHSLGGALASFVADYLGLEATVFAPLPVGEILRKARDMDGLTAHILSAGLPTMTGADYFINLFGLSDLIDDTVIENALIAGYSNLPTGMTEIGPPEAEGGDITIVDIEDQISNWYLNPASDYVGDGRDDYIAISQALSPSPSEASFFHRMDVFAFILATGIDFVEIQDAIPTLNAMLMDDGSGWGVSLVDGAESDSIWKAAVLQDLSEPTSTIDIFVADMEITASFSPFSNETPDSYTREELAIISLAYTAGLVIDTEAPRATLFSVAGGALTINLATASTIWADIAETTDLPYNVDDALEALINRFTHGQYHLVETQAIDVQKNHSAWAITLGGMTSANIFGLENVRNFIIAAGDGATITGHDGDDVLIGAGNDVLFLGGEGDDLMMSLADGSAVSYTGAAGGIHGNLDAGIIFDDGEEGTDFITGIAYLIGSNHDDALVASGIAGANPNARINTGDGNDTVFAARGDGDYDGGDGIDVIDFSQISLLPGEGPTGFRIELADPYDNILSSTFGTYTIQDFEAVIGTALNDKFFGMAGTQVFDGGGGNDFLKGMNGDDVLFGGAGDDRLEGDYTSNAVELRIYAGADNYQSLWPNMKIYVNGDLKATRTVTDQRPTPAWGDVDLNLYEIAVNGITGTIQSLRIELGNDRGSYYHRVNEISGYDINLHIGDVLVNGVSLDTPDIFYTIAGTADNWHPDVQASIWHRNSYVQWNDLTADLADGEGIDILNGGHGNDTLVGGGDLDTFVFEQDWGHDTVEDFNLFEDTINFRAVTGISNASQMMAELAFATVSDGLSMAHADNSVLLKGLDMDDVPDILSAITYDTNPMTIGDFLIA